MPKVDKHASKNMRKTPSIANHNGPPNPTTGREKFLVLRPCVLHCCGVGKAQGTSILSPGWEVHHMILHLDVVHIILLGRCTLHSGWARVQGQSASLSRMSLLPRGGQAVPLFLPIAAPRLQGSITYTPLQPPTFSSYIPGPWQAQNVRGKINPNHVTRKDPGPRWRKFFFWLEWGGGSAK
ncbi:hypothetical protein B0H14DRAFT_2615341 [Mycena olivaceomarginata]|nr:hypothetical protein B0H14DRAFT_2615341 [Mycena olivaceomarginata]